MWKYKKKDLIHHQSITACREGVIRDRYKKVLKKQAK